ncbi:MAG: Gfo/Idh/MocA family oxidoreductase [Bryobacteraceae bacterium]
MSKLRWGVLSTSNFAQKKVIPAMRACSHAEIAAIASRDLTRSRAAALMHSIPKAYGSYEELLADPEIDIVYNPMPNHMHVPWSIRAMEAGKHVLCEKPLGLSVAEVRSMIAARDRAGVKAGEAFMIRTHPQWSRGKDLVTQGAIGTLRAVQSEFSYFNNDPANVRNKLDIGGGGLMDVGCYSVQLSRFLFGEEPRRVIGLLDRDPDLRVDRLCSAMMDFPSGQSVFTCGTQHVPYQRVQILGSKGRIELEIPFNAPPDETVRLLIDDGSDPRGTGIRVETIAACSQYAIQADAFSRAVRDGGSVAVPLEDSLGNMAAIEAIFRSAESGKWETPER